MIIIKIYFYILTSFRAGRALSRWGSSVRGPGGRWGKWRLIHENGTWGDAEEKQRGAAGAVEEGHPAADSAAKDGEGESETPGWVTSVLLNHTHTLPSVTYCNGAEQHDELVSL